MSRTATKVRQARIAPAPLRDSGRSRTAVVERRRRGGDVRVRVLAWEPDPRAAGRQLARARGGFYSMSDADGTGRWIAAWHPNDAPRQRRGRKVSLAFLVPSVAAVQACEEHFLEQQTDSTYFPDAEAKVAGGGSLSGPPVAWKRGRR